MFLGEYLENDVFEMLRWVLAVFCFLMFLECLRWVKRCNDAIYGVRRGQNECRQVKDEQRQGKYGLRRGTDRQRQATY